MLSILTISQLSATNTLVSDLKLLICFLPLPLFFSLSLSFPGCGSTSQGNPTSPGGGFQEKSIASTSSNVSASGHRHESHSTPSKKVICIIAFHIRGDNTHKNVFRWWGRMIKYTRTLSCFEETRMALRCRQ